MIFEALQNRCTDDVILALLDANESAVKKLNARGRLLLYEIIISRYSDRVVMKTFHLYPWAAMIRCKALDTASVQEKYYPRDCITAELPENSLNDLQAVF